MKDTNLKISVLIMLLFVVLISGVAQGILMPVISIILEKKGISSTLAGLHSASYYIGILIVSPFMESLMNRLGFKKVILAGLTIIFLSVSLFPVFESVFIWFLLRLFVGIGGNMIHISSQTWITSTIANNRRGLVVSIYGLSFGLGFAIGPYATGMLEYSINAPFAILAVLSALMIIIVTPLTNVKPFKSGNHVGLRYLAGKVSLVWKYSWIALLFPFTYGILESVLNVNLPVYALRNGMDLNLIAVIISIFALGSVIFQIPLGMISDYYGRKKILALAACIGACAFAASIVFFKQSYVLIFFLFVAGMFVGSIFSLGIAYMVDLLPKQLLPLGTILSGIVFSIGSIIGPIAGGVLMSGVININVLWLIVVLLTVLIVILKVKKTEYSV